MSSIGSIPFQRPTIGTYRDLVDRHGWGFSGLLLVIATLFIRPTDILPEWQGMQLYQGVIGVALFISYRAVGEQLSIRQLASRPVTACLMLLLVSVAASHLANGFFWGARDSTLAAVKVFALYLLIAGVVNSTDRLETFAKWLVLVIATMCALTLADQFGILKISAFTPIEDRYLTGDESVRTLERLRGSGIFEDPNDLGMVVVTGIVLNCYFLIKPNQGWPRYLWLIPGVLLCIALAMTYSRGAFMALAFTIPAWLFYQRGWRVALAGSMALVPILFLTFSGRMTEINAVYEGTGQSRIQIWSDSLQVFRNSPLFGIGEGMLSEQSSYVGHNTFLQSFAELGFGGGSLFIAIFLAATFGLLPNSPEARQVDIREQRLRGAIFAVVVDYAVGMQSLSRQFVAPTFLILGLAVAAQLTGPYAISKSWCIGRELMIRSLLASVFFLALIYILVRLLIHTA